MKSTFQKMVTKVFGGDVVNPRYFSKLKDFHRILAISGTLEMSLTTSS